MKTFIIIAITILNMTAMLHAQRPKRPAGKATAVGIVKGKLIDKSKNRALPYANVMLYRLKDSNLVTGAITSKDGSFIIKKVPFGKYFLKAKFVGFAPKTLSNIGINPSKKMIDLGTIKLNVSSVLKEKVSVVAAKPVMEYKIDRKVLNISQDISSSGGSAVEALENAPSVDVDIEGNITMRGSSNFTVFINGRPSILSGSDALQQIPASAIENIELITNPSAKYDPEGISGIINVVLKKNSALGLNGLISTSIGTYDKYNGNALVDYQGESYNLFLGLNYSDRHFTGEKNIYEERSAEETTTYKDNFGNGARQHDGYSVKTGFEKRFDDKNSVRLETKIGTMSFERQHDSKYALWSNKNPEKKYFSDESIVDRKKDYAKIYIDYIHKFDNAGHVLETSASFSKKEGDANDLQREYISDANWQIDTDAADLRNAIESEKSNDIRLKADYTLPLSDDGKFEAGFQSKLDNEDQVFVTKTYSNVTKTWENVDKYSNNIDFTRNIHSIYAINSGNLFDIGYKLGLRGEFTYRSVKSLKDNTEFELNQFNLFPSVHLSKDLAEGQQLMASYSRRIRRPRGRDLDPFPSYRDKKSFKIGNPELEPEHTDSFEIAFQQFFGKSFFNIEAYYRTTSNLITREFIALPNDTLKMTTTNLDQDHTLGTELSVNYQASKALRFNLSGNYYYYKLDGTLTDNESVNKSTYTWDARLQTTLALGRDTRLQFSALYRPKNITAQGERSEMFVGSLAIKQDFFDKKLSISLNSRDVFGTWKREMTTNTSKLHSTFEFIPERPMINLSISYKFNNFKKKKSSDREEEFDSDM